MPRATVKLDPEDKVDLKTCPGAFVQLKRLSYGQKLFRQESISKMTMEMQRRRGATQKATMEMMQRAATFFDFKMCIHDHNLEDEDGRKLDLSQEKDVTSLDPKIGEEISDLIDKLNNFEADAEEGDS